MKDILQSHTNELHAAAGRADQFHDEVLAVIRQLREAFERGKKVLIAGNGGSAAEAQHFSDEMLGRYRADRNPYPAIALTADTAAITCIGNDYGYEHVFRRQVETLGNEGDVFIGLTTSGTSKNILLAAQQARDNGMTVVALTGPNGDFKDMADYAIKSPSEKASIMQEFHLHAIHLICEAFEPENVGKEL